MAVEVAERNVARSKGRETVSVRIPAELARIAKQVASFEDKDIVEVLSECLEPPLRKRWRIGYDRAGKQMEDPK